MKPPRRDPAPWLWGALLAGLTLAVLWTWHRLPTLPLPLPLGQNRHDTIQVNIPDGRLQLRLGDRNADWDWDWTAPSCTQALARWALPRGIRTLELELGDPETHARGLPIRALYPEGHALPAIAGAWCEPTGPAERTLQCVVAPLAGQHPAHVTTALMGALGQALAYAQDSTAFAAGEAWHWSKWQPLVTAGDAPDQWRSACPVLVPGPRFS